MAKCPICERLATPEHRPFCSARCADLDLHRWLSGRYAVPGAEGPGNLGGEDEED